MLTPTLPRPASLMLLAFLMLSGAVPAYAEAPTQRPRIGLALSGGGARGAAHIGVLQELEALRIPVDCITGTSMGAIVGGAYAAGLSADDLEAAVVATDWDDVFNDKPPRQEQSIRRKADSLKGLSEVELGLKADGIAAARGLVSGVQIESFLRRLTRPVADVAHFAELPIPFKAVATDIETGDAVILDHGSLPQAMRASMAIPGVMAPVELDGKLLVDGGIANNLPIGLVRQTCADVVIAVNIQSTLLKREQLSSAFSITGQLINLLGKSRVDAELATLGENDILIAPDLGDITSGSFERQPEAIARGRDAAQALAATLRRYSLPEDEYLALRSSQTLASNGLGKVAQIRFEGLKRTNDAVLRDLMHSASEDSLSEETLAADMRRIYGRGDFEGIDYRIAPQDGVRTLIVSPREKSWGPDYLGFGLGVASDFTGDSQYNLIVQHRKTWINALGAEWATELKIGWRNRISSEFYQPLDAAGRAFVQPYLSAETYKQSLYVDSERIATYAFEQGTVGLDLGYNFGTVGMLRAGPVWRKGSYTRDTGTALVAGGDYETTGLQIRLLVDQLDRVRLASEGYAFDLTALKARQRDGTKLDYSLLEGHGQLFLDQGPHILGISVEAGTSFNTTLPGQDLFQLGGPLRLSGYRFGEFLGAQYDFARLEYRNRAIRLPAILGSGVFLGGSIETGRMDNLLNTGANSGRRYSTSIFLSANTALGPAYLGFGVGDEGSKTLFLVLGVP
jgi:NTE family protein